jgi:anti-sigma factor RsiW
MALMLTEQDLEQLSQYVDGELPAAERTHLERRLAGEPELAGQLQAMRNLNTTLRSVMLDRSVVPDDILESIARESAAEQPGGRQATTAKVLAFPAPAPAAAPTRARYWPVAAAASVLAAVAVVLMSNGPAQQSGLPGNDRIVSTALDSLPSGDSWTELNDGRELRPVLTFAHRDGTWCREFLLRGGEQDVRAVACREAERWVTQAAGYESYLDSTNAYRPAGASDSAPVSVFISENATGIALGRDEESTLIREGWR